MLQNSFEDKHHMQKKTGFPSNFPKLWGHGVRMARFERRNLPAPSWSSCLVGATSFGPQGSAATIHGPHCDVTGMTVGRLGLGESSPNSTTAMSAIFRFMNYFLIQPDPIYFFGITTYGILGKIIIHGKSQNHKWLWTISKNGPHQIQSMTKLVWVL